MFTLLTGETGNHFVRKSKRIIKQKIGTNFEMQAPKQIRTSKFEINLFSKILNLFSKQKQTN